MIHICSHCGYGDEIALVRPVEGVPLDPPGRGIWVTTEEARLALGWYPGDRAIENPDERALASRLEVSS